VNKLYRYLAALLLIGCAGTYRDCSSGCAGEFGADWVIVQVATDGQPFRCWDLHNVAVTNESNTDGIYWQDSHGNLVHISGFYNRVQVTGGHWNEAFDQLGLTRETCTAIRSQRVSVR
jgi:hypothetical protein